MEIVYDEKFGLVCPDGDTWPEENLPGLADEGIMNFFKREGHLGCPTCQGIVVELFDDEGSFFNGTPQDFPMYVFCADCGAGDVPPDCDF